MELPTPEHPALLWMPWDSQLWLPRNTLPQGLCHICQARVADSGALRHLRWRQVPVVGLTPTKQIASVRKSVSIPRVHRTPLCTTCKEEQSIAKPLQKERALFVTPGGPASS